MTNYCTCATPCCSVDIGVGTMTCGSQHCPVHGFRPEPYCPYCETYAKDMVGLDYYLAESPEEYELFEHISLAERQVRRAEYVRLNEGTYNPDNGHFACDKCYIKIGMPVADSGWIAP